MLMQLPHSCSQSLRLLLCLLQDQQSQALAAISTTPSSGIIPARGSLNVSLCLEAERLGRLQLPVFIQITGSRNKPLQIIADAKAVGPSLQFAVLPVVLAAESSASSDSASARNDDVDTSTSYISCETGADPAQPAEPASAGSAGVRSDIAASTDVVSNTGTVIYASSRSQSGRHPGPNSRTSSQFSKAAAMPHPQQLQWSDTVSVTFNKVQVLRQHVVEVRLRNPTLVDADIKLFVERMDSVFEVSWLLQHQLFMC